MRKSFADIMAEAEAETRTHHERQAAVTQAHFEKHPELAVGVDVEKRCQAGWWDKTLASPFADAPELFELRTRRPVLGYQKMVLTGITVDLARIPRYYASERGQKLFEQAEQKRQQHKAGAVTMVQVPKLLPEAPMVAAFPF